jgi:hypothetical protein
MHYPFFIADSPLPAWSKLAGILTAAAKIKLKKEGGFIFFVASSRELRCIVRW